MCRYVYACMFTYLFYLDVYAGVLYGELMGFYSLFLVVILPLFCLLLKKLYTPFYIFSSVEILQLILSHLKLGISVTVCGIVEI